MYTPLGSADLVDQGRKYCRPEPAFTPSTSPGRVPHDLFDARFAHRPFASPTWELRAEGAPFIDATVDDGGVFAATTGHILRAGRDGRVVWTRPLGGDLRELATVPGGVLVVLHGESMVLNDDGTVRWRSARYVRYDHYGSSLTGSLLLVDREQVTPHGTWPSRYVEVDPATGEPGALLDEHPRLIGRRTASVTMGNLTLHLEEGALIARTARGLGVWRVGGVGKFRLLDDERVLVLAPEPVCDRPSSGDCPSRGRYAWVLVNARGRVVRLMAASWVAPSGDMLIGTLDGAIVAWRWK